jgi:hypothetical protein
VNYQFELELSLISYTDAAVEILKSEGSKGLHIDDIVERIVQSNDTVKDPKELIRTKINQFLSNRAGPVKKPRKGSEIRRVNNPKTGRPRQGVYKFYKCNAPTPSPTIPVAPKTTSSYFGTAGEYAVASEYLFNGYNVSIPSVDTGIDLIVFKGGRFSNVQVKTASEVNGKFQFTIRNKALSNNSGIDTYYVLVCRRLLKQGFQNDCIVLPSTSIDFLLSTGVLKQSENTTSLHIVITNSQFMLNGSQDVTKLVNKFDH